VFDKIRNRDRTRQSAHDVDVINPATGPPRETTGPFNVVTEHAKHFFAEFRVLKECLAILRTEDKVQPDLRQDCGTVDHL